MNSIATAGSLSDLNQKIQEKGYEWVAAENWTTQLSVEEREQLCGAQLGPAPGTEPKLISLGKLATTALPEKFDWRDNNGNWVTSVKDQGTCGSCWAFSALAQVEAWYRIQTNNPDTTLDLSEQMLISCSGAGNCEDGGWTTSALDYVVESGIVNEPCLPYQGITDYPCQLECPAEDQQRLQIPGWGYVTLEEVIVNNIKHAVMSHPLSVSFLVYTDFSSYSSGVYEPVSKTLDGAHAVLIVGWDDSEQSWIVKNSWGPSWGENGYFRIRWGTCNMGAYSPFIYDAVLDRPSLSLSANRFDFALTRGDTASAEFTVTNIGNKPLEFSIVDYGDLSASPAVPSADPYADWISLKNSGGKILPGESRNVTIQIETRHLNPGHYKGFLLFFSNDPGAAGLRINLSADVKAPDYDAAMTSVRRANETPFLSLFSWVTLEAEMENMGKNPQRDFKIRCDIELDGHPFLSDTVNVDYSSLAGPKIVSFKPFLTTENGQLSVRVQLLDMANDYNQYNDELTTELEVKNLVDNFERGTKKWISDGHFSVTNRWSGHYSTWAAHVAGGEDRYFNNESTTLTYGPGFCIPSQTDAYLTYYTRYLTWSDGDVCVTEIKNNLQDNWVTVDSMYGVQSSWEMRAIDLKPLLGPNVDRVDLRFRFYSD
ncbi:hypothetical protein KAH55_10100, partial [bacterium]|nr:hypothetical protein [bacterium]